MSLQLSVGIALVIAISLKVQVKFIICKNVCSLSVLRHSTSVFFGTKLVLFKFRVLLSNIDR
jgi:hypothetical protein